MDTVAFITTESGDDLILSFALQDLEDPSEIESLILLRTPKYEFIVEEDKRGVSVSFERYPDEEDDHLKAVEYLEAERIVRLKTLAREYELDVGKVDASELKKMRQILLKMNYDRKFQTTDQFPTQ
jgi:hypothetical protein